MNEKIYCFQCHNSVYKNTIKLPNSHPLKSSRICLYCYRDKHFYARNRLMNGCRNCNPESLAKLLSGEWKPNKSTSKRPG